MKLVFYSGGSFEDNKLLNEALVSMFSDLSHIMYIPSNSDGYEPYFQQFQSAFSDLGIKNINAFSADREFSAEQLENLLKSDAIFLSGGNTFYFLDTLKKKGLIEPLQGFVEQRGVLAGMSAGALIMTPNINTASIPSFDSDDNLVGLKELSALDLTHFEFSPHYLPLEAIDNELLNYSKTTDNPVIACTEGSGIVIQDEKLSLIGTATLFTQGQKTKLV